MNGIGKRSGLDIARELSRTLRDVLHELNLDDPGDSEDVNADRLERAERHANFIVTLLTDCK